MHPHRSHTTLFAWVRFFLVIPMLLTACGQAAAPAAVPTEDLVATEVSRLLTATPGSTPGVADTAAAEPATAVPAASTATTAPTAVPTNTLPAPTPTPAEFSPAALRTLSPEELSNPETYRGAIVYLGSDEGNGKTAALELVVPALNAAMRITPEGMHTALYKGGDGKVKFFSYQSPTERAFAKGIGWEEVPAPEECRLAASAQRSAPCMEPVFSADGRYLVYFVPPGNCGSKMNIVDFSNNRVVFTLKSGGHWAYPMPDGQIMYAGGHCEGGRIVLVNPTTTKQTVLGAEGTLMWNPQRTAFVVSAFDEGGYHLELWGYNVETNQHFLKLTPYGSSEFDDPRVWTPDGQFLLYHHLPYFYNKNTGEFHLKYQNEIIQVDIATGEKEKLFPTSDQERYSSFYLCSSSVLPCQANTWADGLIPIYRREFKPVIFNDSMINDHYIESPSEANCVVNGRDCQGSLGESALDTKTMEVVYWDAVPLQTQVPPQQQQGNAWVASAGELLYQDPAGKFKLVITGSMFYGIPRDENMDQNAGVLWLVPASGEPSIFAEWGREYMVLK
jgi:hypothetical protein